MASKLLLVGAGGFGRVALEHAVEQYDCAFVDDGPELGTLVNGVAVIGRISDLQLLHDEAGYEQLIVTIGNEKQPDLNWENPKLREEIYNKAKTFGYSFPNIICTSAYVSRYAELGSGCVLLNNVVVQNGAHVGDGVLLNPGVEVHHDSFVDDCSLIYTNSVVRTLAHVGKRVRIGSNVSISNNVNIADDSDIPNGTTL